MKLTLPLDPDGSELTPVLIPEPTVASAPDAIDSTDSNSAATVRSELLLVCEARSTTLTDGFWRFALETADGQPVLDAEDQETGDLNRLTLLAAVRGLEAIEGASSVTLLSNNRYLIRSLSDSLPRWRQNGFIWEHFGRRIDVQHADLWRRVDRALKIHRVEACLVSSRLVSAGQADVSHDAIGSNGTINRIDSAHGTGGSAGGGRMSVPAPKRRSRGTAVEMTAAASGGSSPNDRLRSWLLASTQSSSNTLPQRRFTPRDLVENA
ncbi:ribonuclease HI [Stieleria marina]|uniref:Ribonuclease HI n=1 Tax=Stieleria marina TaxID=1930275 RepID=A0A517NW76_9BACT|nr:Ribonuclease HI [Planctomycetes bacterium K23_9]